MRRLLFGCLLLVGVGPMARAQSPATDSLRRVLARTTADTSRVLALLQLAYSYRASKPDSFLHLTQAAEHQARRFHFAKGEGRALGQLGTSLRERGDLPGAYAYLLRARELTRQSHDLEGEAFVLNTQGNIGLDLQQYAQAIGHFQRALRLFRRLRLYHWQVGALTNIGGGYEKLNRLDSALVYQQRAESLLHQHPRPRLAAALALRNMGLVQARLGHPGVAQAYYRRALREAAVNNDLRNRSMTEYQLARLFEAERRPDSSLWYARRAVRSARQVMYRVTILGAGTLAARLYRARHQPDSALRYQSLALAAQDSLYGPEKFRQLALLTLREQAQERQQREAQLLQAARYQRAALLAGLGLVLTVALLLGWAYRTQRRANRQLSERNARIAGQRNELNEALVALNATQGQLVQAEKWAFVGELSAGLAHELQNPLAFMQRFADTSAALLNEDEAGAGLRRDLQEGLQQNLHDIGVHGRRASAIVADLLAHARPTPTALVPTDLNALVADALRQAYQGAPAAPPPAVDLETSFDPAVGTVPAHAADLTRALLGLFTNALYAVRQRQAASAPGFQPRVDVHTKRLASGEVEICIRDNGPGIGPSVLEQMFEPFFSTKPAGEGTGLGLALARDIITRQHRGHMDVETRDGEFTVFRVRLPG